MKINFGLNVYAGTVRARGREFSSYSLNPAEDPTSIAYRAMLDVPRELVTEWLTLLRAERLKPAAPVRHAG